jgi:phosphatidylglycerophosphate synthase
MGCGVAAGAAVAATPAVPEVWQRVLWFSAAVLIPLRLTANLLDGMVAIGAGRASRLGELFNVIPDRVSDSAVLIGLGYARSSEPVLGFVAALLAVLTAYVRAVGKNAGAPQVYAGPMAKPQRMWLVTAFCVAAAVAPDAMTAPLPGLAFTPPAVLLLLVGAGCALTVARRLVLIRRALAEAAG